MPDALRGAVIALGNFDGFHSGHQAVVRAAKQLADKMALPLIVASFDPHPVNLFQPAARPFRLTSLSQRQHLFAAAGASAMLLIEFGPEMAATSAEDFIDKLLVERFGAGGIVTGSDFGFGREKRGSAKTLQAAADDGKFAYIAVDPVNNLGEPVSSSRIREALVDGDPGEAAFLLTRPFAIEGEVEHGDKVGRSLGFPTINVALSTYLRPRYGVYAVSVKLPDGRIMRGAANIGVRPQFEPPVEKLEVHLLGYSGDLYGETVEVAFHSYLRDEARFNNIEQLKTQMAADCERARYVLTAEVMARHGRF